MRPSAPPANEGMPSIVAQLAPEVEATAPTEQVHCARRAATLAGGLVHLD